MRILFVAMHNSIHTCRWINQLAGLGWDVHLFPSWYGDTHADLKETTVHELFYRRPKTLASSVRIKGLRWPLPVSYLTPARGITEHLLSMTMRSSGITMPPFPTDQVQGIGSKFFPWPERAHRLARLIRKIKPDIIQSMEIQHAGYLTLEAKKLMGGRFPPWIVNNWGNDIYLFGRLQAHRQKIREVLSSCDYYSCECERDVGLARESGFQGEVLPVIPNCGGFDLDKLASLRQSGPPSERRTIFVKGYQDWHGRALVALRAIGLCADLLRQRQYTVALHSASVDVKIAAELVSNETGIPFDYGENRSSEDMMRLHGKSRAHIGLAISDGIAITSLEALVMGSLPIQSCSACANEWIVDGENGFIVPPEDPESIAAVIRRVVSDDALVDHAADINLKIARERLDQQKIRPQVIRMYEGIYEQIQAGKRKSS